MTKREVQSSLILYILILFLVSIVPSLELLHSDQASSNIKALGPEIGFFLALGIYLKWKYIDMIFYFIITAAILFDIILFLNSNFSINFILLSICHVALLIIFIFSKYIRHYIKSGYPF